MKITIVRRVLIVSAIFALLVFVGRTEIAFVALFAVGMLLSIIPSIVLLILTAAAAWLVIRVFAHSKLVSSLLLALFIGQAVILFSWFEGWTAASAYMNHSREAGLPVIDPQIENRLMTIFWLSAAFVMAVLIEHLIESFRSIKTEIVGRSSRKAQMGIMLFATFLLLSLHSNVVNYCRIPRNVNIPTSLSPDGRREVQLVPINAWIDTDGIAIAREPHSLIWRTIGKVGDVLTEADRGRFVWSGDSSKVYLLLNLRGTQDYTVLGFDFKTNQPINPEAFSKQK